MSESPSIHEILKLAESQMLNEQTTIRAKFSHSGNKGTNAEEIFRKFLREYLPRTFGVSGFQKLRQIGFSKFARSGSPAANS